MRAVQVSKAGGPLELVEREIPQPGPRQVRVKVQAGDGDHSVAGTVSDGRPVSVEIGDYELHLPAVPGYLLMTRHDDRPGIIGDSLGDHGTRGL